MNKPDIYYNLKNFLLNLRMFIKLAWNYRSWDYYYIVEVMVVLMKDQAKTLRKHGLRNNKEKICRRYYHAAGLLEQAYLKNITDPACLYWQKTYPYKIVRRPIGGSMYTQAFLDMDCPEDKKALVKKLRDVAEKRADEREQARRKEAWEYLAKHNESFWD